MRMTQQYDLHGALHANQPPPYRPQMESFSFIGYDTSSIICTTVTQCILLVAQCILLVVLIYLRL
jgi:hypothetical protein